jgi:hypothetical protein
MHHPFSLRISQSLQYVSIFYAKCTESFMTVCAPELLFYGGQREISKSSLGHKMKANTEEKVLDLWVSNQIVQLSYPNPNFKSKYL